MCDSEIDSSPASSLDFLFDLLKNDRRRTLLSLLVSYDRTVTVNDLTKDLVQQEYDASITDVSSETVHNIYLSLQHSHIPRLADEQFVHYDETRGTIEPTETLMQVGDQLEQLDILQQ